VLCGGHAGAAGWLLNSRAEGAKFPMAGLTGGGRGIPAKQLISEMSEGAPIPLRAAFIVSRLALMASPASLTSSWASVAAAADWFTTRSLPMAIISFLAVPSFLARSRSSSSGSCTPLVTASVNEAIFLMAFLRGLRESSGPYLETLL
jgi:hypothetical protein